MQLFYAPEIVDQSVYVMPEEEARHALRVLRLTTGDAIDLVDGRGGLYHGRITVADRSRCEVVLEEKIEEFGKRNFSVHIAIAPTKNIERLEWFLEKATEIGVDEITPLLCEHSERKVIKPERLEKVMVAAMKQSCKAYLPTLHPLTSCKEFIRWNKARFRGIAHCEPGDKKMIHHQYTPGQSATLMIGPEGDFSPEEIRLALQEGFSPVSLGESRLRTETAGLVACHTIHLLNEQHHSPTNT